jgi:phosphoglycolate phosphatase
LEKLELVKKLIIFDLDGTLIDSADQIYTAACLTRETLHYAQAPKEILTRRIGLAAEELFFDLDLSNAELVNAVEMLRTHIGLLKLTELNLFPNVKELLRLLISRDYLLAVGTNKPLWLADKALTECKIRGSLSLVVGGDSLPLKPDKAIIENCLNYFHIPATSAIMIGDRIEDIRAASSARVTSYGVLQGVHNQNQLYESGAKKVFLGITDLYGSLVRGWNFDDL